MEFHNLPPIISSKDRESSLHLQVQVKTLPCKSKSYINNTQICSWLLCSVQRSAHGPHFKLLLEIVARDGKDHPDCYQRKASVTVWGCGSVHDMGNLHICETYIQLLEQHMLQSKERLCLFQQNNARPHSARVTTVLLPSESVRVLHWPACSPDASPTSNVWRIMAHKAVETPDCWATELAYELRMEKNSTYKTWTITVLGF